MNTTTPSVPVKPEPTLQGAKVVPKIVSPIVTTPVPDNSKCDPSAQAAPIVAAKGDDDLMSQKQS